ncbi:hypothetical protein [Amycolatopsis sp. NPDC050768]|uniref:hypothetical protein n=1 Tax=Amycolatopsis sp. NPDC050768 TaxID=3154839 RepID=UPI00340F5D78
MGNTGRGQPCGRLAVGDGAEAGDAAQQVVSSSTASIAPHDTLNAFIPASMACCGDGKPNTLQVVKEVSFAIAVRRA